LIEYNVFSFLHAAFCKNLSQVFAHGQWQKPAKKYVGKEKIVQSGRDVVENSVVQSSGNHMYGSKKGQIQPVVLLAVHPDYEFAGVRQILTNINERGKRTLDELNNAQRKDEIQPTYIEVIATSMMNCQIRNIASIPSQHLNTDRRFDRMQQSGLALTKHANYPT
jgi:hypothetical protein